MEAALQLVRDLQEDKLAVASESVVIATTSSIVKQVVTFLARRDIHIQGADQAKDLGLDVSSARKPMRRTMAKRWTKGWETNKKMREVWKMDFETGSLGAESPRNGGCGGAADVDQAGEDESRSNSSMRRTR